MAFPLPKLCKTATTKTKSKTSMYQSKLKMYLLKKLSQHVHSLYFQNNCKTFQGEEYLMSVTNIPSIGSLKVF